MGRGMGMPMEMSDRMPMRHAANKPCNPLFFFHATGTSTACVLSANTAVVVKVAGASMGALLSTI